MSPIATVCEDIAANTLTQIYDPSSCFSKEVIKEAKKRYITLLYLLAVRYCVDRKVPSSSWLWDSERDAKELDIQMSYSIDECILVHDLYTVIKELHFQISCSPEKEYFVHNLGAFIEEDNNLSELIVYKYIFGDFLCCYDMEIERLLEKEMLNLFDKVEEVALEMKRDDYRGYWWRYKFNSIKFPELNDPDNYPLEKQYANLGESLGSMLYWKLVDELQAWLQDGESYRLTRYEDLETAWGQMKWDIEHGDPTYCEDWAMAECESKIDDLLEPEQYLLWLYAMGWDNNDNAYYPYIDNTEEYNLAEAVSKSIFQVIYSRAEEELQADYEAEEEERIKEKEEAFEEDDED